MILASGNVVHNLQRIQWRQPSLAYDWAERFDDAVAEQMEREPGDILQVLEHPDYGLAVPTPDHLVPLLHIAAPAAADNARPNTLLRGYSMGSIWMTCYGVGTNLAQQADAGASDAGTAATLPGAVPPDQTNT
jgi:4,5-DOPA dioxygenase extradiol